MRINRKFIIVIFLLVIIFASFIVNAETKTQKTVYTKPMISELLRKCNKGSIDSCNTLIKISPNMAELYYMRGLAFMGLFNFEISKKNYLVQAEKDFSKAIQLEPNYPEAYGDRGSCKDYLGNYEGAILDYTKAIKLEPNYKEAYYNRGNANGRVGKYQEALKDYDYIINNFPKQVDGGDYCNRGLVYSELGNFNAALNDFNQAIKLEMNSKIINSEKAKSYNNRGTLKEDLKDFNGAIADYDKAIELHPQYANAYYNKAMACIKLNMFSKSIENFEKAKDLYQKQNDNKNYQKTIMRINQVKNMN